MMEVLGKGVSKAGRGYNNMDHMDKKNLVPFHPLSNVEIFKYFNQDPRVHGVFSRENLLE